MGKVEWGQKRKFIFITNINEKKKNMGDINIKEQKLRNGDGCGSINRNSEEWGLSYSAQSSSEHLILKHNRM